MSNALEMTIEAAETQRTVNSLADVVNELEEELYNSPKGKQLKAAKEALAEEKRKFAEVKRKYVEEMLKWWYATDSKAKKIAKGATVRESERVHIRKEEAVEWALKYRQDMLSVNEPLAKKVAKTYDDEQPWFWKERTVTVTFPSDPTDLIAKLS